MRNTSLLSQSYLMLSPSLNKELFLYFLSKEQKLLEEIGLKTFECAQRSDKRHMHKKEDHILQQGIKQDGIFIIFYTVASDIYSRFFIFSLAIFFLETFFTSTSSSVRWTTCSRSERIISTWHGELM